MMLLRRLLYYLRSIVTLLTGLSPARTVLAVFLGLPVARPFEIRVRESGLRLKARSRMDVWIIKESCLDRDYERIGVPVRDGWAVVDIGAALGDFALDAALRHPRAMVHAYEPSPESFKLLQENARLNELSNVTLHREAINSDGRPLQLDVSRTAVQHSTAAQSDGGAGKVTVPATTLRHVTERLPGECDLLKMDCEGAEYEIILTADDETLARVRRIVMEYHDNVVESSHQDLAAFLSAKGYSVNVHPSPVQPDLGLLFASRTKE